MKKECTLSKACEESVIGTIIITILVTESIKLTNILDIGKHFAARLPSLISKTPSECLLQNSPNINGNFNENIPNWQHRPARAAGFNFLSLSLNPVTGEARTWWVEMGVREGKSGGR